VNWTARRTFGLGLSLRTAETGQLRQYVVFIVVGTVALAVLVSFWSSSFTGLNAWVRKPATHCCSA